MQTTNKTQLTIVDSIMGAGKTSWAIEHMNEDPAPWLYVSPLLPEAKRIIAECPDRQFIQPLANAASSNGWTSTKSADLLRLIQRGENIATTHALFKLMQPDTIEAIKDAGYKMILDEVVDMVEPLKVTTEMHQTLFAKGMLTHDPESDPSDKVRKVLPGPDADLDGLFVQNGTSLLTVQKVRSWAATNRLVEVDGRLLVWLLPVDAFNAFQEAYNLTYMFEGSLACPYLDLQGVGFDYQSVTGNRTHGYSLTGYDPHIDDPFKANIWSLINLYEGNLNVPGNHHQALSWNKWNKDAGGIRSVMRPKLNTYFKKYGLPGTSSNENMWTVFKSAKDALVDKNVAKKSWLACNARATNDWKHKANVAYLCNTFANVPIIRYFSALGYHINEDQFALSQLIQWIWRSRIREDQPISAYIPSFRMRSLLKEWANGAGAEPKSTVIPLEKAA